MTGTTTAHDVTPEEIMAFMDGELSAESATAISRHLENCTECGLRLDEFRATSRSLAAWTIQPAEPGNIRRRLLEVQRVPQVSKSSLGYLLRPHYLAALGVAALALTFWAQMSPSRIYLQEPEVRAKLKKTESPNPNYPEEARQKQIQGIVKLHILVDRKGSVKHLDVVAGDPMLAKAAVDGVRKWKFEPTYAKGKAVEVDSVVEINFQLVD